MAPQRHLKYFEPGILFTILGLLHAALLFSFAHGISTTTTTTTVHISTITVTARTTWFGPKPSPPSQTIKFQDPENPEETLTVACPDRCHGGAACEWVSPFNCSEYYNCDYRREPLLLACEDGLHFWDKMKQCAPPVQAKCKLNQDKKKRVGSQDL